MKKRMQINPLKISIITPSYNQAKFIEQTILSVLEQDYSNLEYIVIDGGSTDGTQQILKKYVNKIKWISETDMGQSDAINKGLKFSTGDVITYLNSDDLLIKGCLKKISDYFQEYPKTYWVTGKCQIIDEENKTTRNFITDYKNFYLRYLRKPSSLFVINYISQPATFWQKKIVEEIGIFDESLKYSMDYDYWLRIITKYPLGYIDDVLASFRTHQSSKSRINLEKQLRESIAIMGKFTNSNLLKSLRKLHNFMTLFFYKNYYFKNEF